MRLTDKCTRVMLDKQLDIHVGVQRTEIAEALRQGGGQIVSREELWIDFVQCSGGSAAEDQFQVAMLLLDELRKHHIPVASDQKRKGKSRRSC